MLVPDLFCGQVVEIDTEPPGPSPHFTALYPLKLEPIKVARLTKIIIRKFVLFNGAYAQFAAVESATGQSASREFAVKPVTAEDRDILRKHMKRCSMVICSTKPPGDEESLNIKNVFAVIGTTKDVVTNPGGWLLAPTRDIFGPIVLCYQHTKSEHYAISKQKINLKFPVTSAALHEIAAARKAPLDLKAKKETVKATQPAEKSHRRYNQFRRALVEELKHAETNMSGPMVIVLRRVEDRFRYKPKPSRSGTDARRGRQPVAAFASAR